MLLVVCLEVSNNFLAIRTFNESCVGNAICEAIVNTLLL